MSKLRYLSATPILLLFALSNSMARETPQPQGQPTIPAQYAATAIGQAGSAAGKTFGLSVYIEGLTPDGEVDELIGTLKSKGQDGVVKAMENMKDLGRLAPTGSVGTGMRLVRIRQNPDGGQHIVLATNRPITFRELWSGTRSRDYPIGIVVLNVDKDGKGTGTLALACKVKFNKKGELEIEHYGIKPLRLANVYRQK